MFESLSSLWGRSRFGMGVVVSAYKGCVKEVWFIFKISPSGLIGKSYKYAKKLKE